MDEPDAALVNEVAAIYYSGRYEIEPMVRRLLLSPQFRDPANYNRRYSWPVEFVVRAIREVGFQGFSVNDALTPLANMGQQLLEPPDVSGWNLGSSWFSTGAVLARMNFAAALATNQKFALRDSARGQAQTPEALLSWALDRLSATDVSGTAMSALADYASSEPWTGSDAQLAAKASGLAHLIVGSADYQFI